MQIARKFESFISRKLRLSRVQNKRKLCEEMSDNFRTWQGMNVAFGNRTEKVDWRRLASTDIGKIKREMDYKTLQDNIMHITFCNIESEMGMYGGPLDPNFVKLFQLSQLIIEYLLHSQEFLSASLDETCKKAEKDLENAKENKMLLEKKTEACHKQKKEIRRLKKWIAEYQLLMRAGASGLHKCPMCDKSFVSQEYLIGHVNRRHQIPQQSNGLQMSGFQKPQSEQKQSLPPAVSGIEKSVLMDELSQIKERLQVTEQDLMNERNARETLIQRERDQQFKQDAKVQEIEEKYEKWKVFEGKKHQREMDVLKNSLMQELRELQEQKDSVTQVLSELQEQARVRPSMLGTLKDEDEPDFSRRLDRDEIAEVMKEQFNVELNKLVAQNKQEMQKELQKLNQKWKKKEENIQREHETEMTKLQNLLGQYEQSFHAERNEKEVLTREYEHLRKKVQDHDKALNTQRDMKEKLEQSIQRQQQQLNALSPPTVPRRETTFTLDNTPTLMERPKTPIQEEIQFRERAKTPSQAGEMILLHVSCNESRNQYRLWRERSNTSKEWTDMYSFSAASQPSEQFMSPVYVYSSGGSPYWRQYISASPKPPSSEYRMDYMFFVSSSPGPGMVQLHVLDSGSVPVIKSCVSKSNNLPGWKDKGLSFYVIKSSMASKTAMSVSLDSTLESAAVNENPDKSFHESESEAESEDEDVMEESKNVYESSGSVSQSLEDSREMTSVLSSSEWGTTLPEVGEFRPYPNNPYITTRFNHKPPVLQVCRQEIVEVIERKLEKQGIAPGVQQLSSQKMEARMSALNHERQTRAKKMKGSDENRQRCAQRLEEIARKTFNRESSTKPSVAGEAVSRPLPTIRQPDTLTQSRPPTLKAAGQAARMSVALQQPNRNQVRTSQTLSSTGSSGGDATLTATSVTERSSFTATSVTDHTLSESEGEDEDEEDEEDLHGSGESDDSNWDNSISDEGIEDTAVPRVAVHIPTQTGIKTREPRGEKVRELTASLERNLSIGRDVKKPAGAVSLFNDQGPGQQRTTITNDDLDDDSDFSITSMEEDKRPSPTPRTITGAKMSSTYNPPPRSQPQPVARPRTLTPSTRPDQQQTSAVTAFTFDDDDFDDDDLDIHHLT